MDYQWISTLGRGAHGTVSLVMQLKSKKYFAMKHIFLDDLEEGELDNPMNEVNLLKKLKHPNIIQYHECRQQNNKLVIVMDYAE